MWRRWAIIGAVVLLNVAALMAIAARRPPSGDVLDAIRARGELVAGVKLDTPPFGFVDAADRPAGFDLDLMRAVGRRLGVPVRFVQVSSPTRIPVLVSGNVDLVAASMTHTRERDAGVDFSITYYTGGQGLLVPPGSDIKGVDGLAGRRVAVPQGTTLESNLRKRAPKAIVLAFRDYNSAWLALAQGRADALTGSGNVLQGFAKSDPRYRLVGEPFGVEPFGVAMRQGQSRLRHEVNMTIMDLWTSGEYARLYRKWLNGAEPTTPVEVWP